MDTTLTKQLETALDIVFDGYGPGDLMEFSGLPLSECEEMYEKYSRKEDLTIQELSELLFRAVDGNRPQHLESYTGSSFATCEEVYKLAFSQGGIT